MVAMEAAPSLEYKRLILAAWLLVGPAAIAVACSSSDESTTTTPDAGIDQYTPPPVQTTTPEASIEPPDTGSTVDAGPPPRGRDKISQTGLYIDTKAKTINPDALPYAAEFSLWVDGADKARWIRLPPGKQIDTTDPDHWVFPVGTQLFKEFTLDGKRVETRLVEHIADTGDPKADYWLGAFSWNDDESDADFVPQGAENVRGTPHDIPSTADCMSCHNSEPGHVLGFSALQLSHDGFLSQLAAKGFIPFMEEKPLPGNPVQRAALGYLHANCGHCHNPNGIARAYNDMTLRFSYGGNLEDAGPIVTTIGVKTQSFTNYPGISERIAPGDPDASCVAFRPSVRDGNIQMPPLGTEMVDDVGLGQIRAWIESLPDGGTH